MKRKILLSESELIRLIKRIISESIDLGQGYIISANNGNIQVLDKSKNQKRIFKLFAKKLMWIPVTVKDIYTSTNNKMMISVSALGKTQESELKQNQILNLIKTNWTSNEFTFTNQTGTDLKFVKTE